VQPEHRSGNGKTKERLTGVTVGREAELRLKTNTGVCKNGCNNHSPMLKKIKH
jgi:hypothetical protein